MSLAPGTSCTTCVLRPAMASAALTGNAALSSPQRETFTCKVKSPPRYYRCSETADDTRLPVCFIRHIASALRFARAEAIFLAGGRQTRCVTFEPDTTILYYCRWIPIHGVHQDEFTRTPPNITIRTRALLIQNTSVARREAHPCYECESSRISLQTTCVCHGIKKHAKSGDTREPMQPGARSTPSAAPLSFLNTTVLDTAPVSHDVFIQRATTVH